MINNDIQNQLGRYLNNHNSKTGGGSILNDMIRGLKAKHEAAQGKTMGKSVDTSAETAESKNEKQSEKTIKQNQLQRYYNRKNGIATEKPDSNAAKTTSKEEDEELTPMQRREKELKAIMAKLDAEEAQRNASRHSNQKDKASSNDKTSENGTVTTSDPSALSGIDGFLNDMPLFDEFKSGLVKAFESLDKASAGAISAQYELNYTSIQYIANAAGGYDYQETAVNVKLDLNYIKAAAGGQTGKELSNAIAESTDFASMIENLQKVGQSQQSQQTQLVTPQNFMTSLLDYFSPEKTAGRIVDFATAFFPLSNAYKKGGDTEESRAEFGEMMRKAIQKGFDQAMGKLGKVPKATQDGIDKTHELTMAGIDDFIKNGLNQDKQNQGIYSALEQFSMNFEINYSHKTVSVLSGTYNNTGAINTQNAQNPARAVDTEA